VGVFQEGYRFDAVVIDGGARHGNLRLGGRDTPEELVQKIIYHAARVNIRDVWVANRRVHAQGATPA
jgi:guanine deaminase